MIAQPINPDAPLKRWCVRDGEGKLVQRPADVGGGMYTFANRDEAEAFIAANAPKPAPPKSVPAAEPEARSVVAEPKARRK